MAYTCARCNYVTASSSSYRAHLQRKTPCDSGVLLANPEEPPKEPVLVPITQPVPGITRR
jgi:hypothetical protein